jgi:acid phosphatase
VEKVLVIVEENRSVADVTAHMPFLTGQGRRYATASNYYAIRHPSLPNYLVMAGGSTFGVTDDEDPDAHRLAGPSVFGQLLAHGQSVKTYAEASPGPCALRNHGTYAVRHNPWTYFADPAERRACQQFDVPSGTPGKGALAEDVTSGNLPTLGFLIPDVCHDGHDCSAAVADRWLQSWLPTIKHGPDFRAGTLAVVVTWDEDDGTSGNRVPFVVLHPSLHGQTVRKRLDHTGFSASLSRIGGASPLRGARHTADVLHEFGL